MPRMLRVDRSLRRVEEKKHTRRFFWLAAVYSPLRNCLESFAATSSCAQKTIHARSKMRSALVVAAGLLSGADALLPLSGYLRKPVQYSAGSLDEVRKQNMRMQDSGLELETDDSPPPDPPKFDPKTMPGVTGPLGYFDPLGFCAEASEGKVRFYREVELKHGRVAMLASLGFLVGESFHPLWGGEVDVPSYIAFQETPLQPFWPAVVFIIAVPEVFSVFTFESPVGGEQWAIRADHEAGDFQFDPLGLKPEGAAELLEMQNKELNNGRLAMIAAAGMIGQELATGNKLF
eukprot:scaffold58283_cov41-Phaeocystis_antarctica.AAC.7